MPRKISWPGSSQPPPTTERISSSRESTPESTQKKQKAWILKTINPSNTPLNTAMPRDTEKRPHQVRRLSSALFSLRPGSSGSRAISSTAP